MAVVILVVRRIRPGTGVISPGNPRPQLGMIHLNPCIQDGHLHPFPLRAGPLLTDRWHADMLHSPGIALGDGVRRWDDTDEVAATVHHAQCVVGDILHALYLLRNGPA